MNTLNLKKVGTIEFPAAKDININMMPFIMGDHNSIPEEYRHYSKLIDACNVNEDEIGKVGYLSISEGMIKKNATQRRPGIHTEKHSNLSWGAPGPSPWGGISGGLFIASNLDNTCRIWDTHIEVPGEMGDCEHLRNSLGEGVLMKKGELFWMTDGTPHEAISQEEDSYRQWFRVVTSRVGVWYKMHSTENRLGTVPNCKIITESKFA